MEGQIASHPRVAPRNGQQLPTDSKLYPGSPVAHRFLVVRVKTLSTRNADRPRPNASRRMQENVRCPRQERLGHCSQTKARRGEVRANQSDAPVIDSARSIWWRLLRRASAAVRTDSEENAPASPCPRAALTGGQGAYLSGLASPYGVLPAGTEAVRRPRGIQAREIPIPSPFPRIPSPPKVALRRSESCGVNSRLPPTSKLMSILD